MVWRFVGLRGKKMGKRFFKGWIGRVDEAKSFPKGYGLVYYDPIMRTAVVMPIPLNLVVSVLRLCYLWLKEPPLFKKMRDYKAYQLGWIDGHAAGANTKQDFLQRQKNLWG